MSINISHIFTGATNDLKAKIGLLPENLKVMASKRFNICETCPEIYFDKKVNSLRCGNCTCFISWATKSPEHKCPLNKW